MCGCPAGTGRGSSGSARYVRPLADNRLHVVGDGRVQVQLKRVCEVKASALDAGVTTGPSAGAILRSYANISFAG